MPMFCAQCRCHHAYPRLYLREPGFFIAASSPSVIVSIITLSGRGATVLYLDTASAQAKHMLASTAYAIQVRNFSLALQ